MSTRLHELGALLDEVDDINAMTENGSTIMHFAALTSSAGSLIPFLVDRGVWVDSTNHYGATPLHWAARNPDPAAVESLLQFGASPSAVDMDHNTPLHYAAENGNVDSADALLEESSHALHVANYSGLTPVACASNQKMASMVMFLLKNGAPWHNMLYSSFNDVHVEDWMKQRAVNEERTENLAHIRCVAVVEP